MSPWKFSSPGSNRQGLRRRSGLGGCPEFLGDRGAAGAPRPVGPSGRLNGALAAGLMLLVLDNYDSFTFNLVQYLGELAADHPITEDLRVERNDALRLEQIR